ncbi:hypothetical protein COCSUDRAFT_33037 [Coccomyxa subellipsoidea C-169]|uniref:Uncharacterized protein n=1 Tax=Coccomyxa subellipsoidea (strain C-169) TaxID=574566 RepID=I0Z120_COCSC|nr:hypothetical protein COCSUDRAFT_33037 [Coccomyxa subellipsoidea C-169]EIE24339.1 hypothetical protein COCSUDRAFT_33037 [Coccomyxa subellipsoidea C-169]|eukprot:XP_005648883.1 hypothetical protein COCSUDRAFT_33037 [Coccomyxa subellipsoidea C-169]
MPRGHRTNFFKELKAWPDARKGRIRSLEIETEREEDVSSAWLPGLECLSLWFWEWLKGSVVFPPPLAAPLSRLSQLQIRASSVTIRLPSSVMYVRILAEECLKLSFEDARVSANNMQAFKVCYLVKAQGLIDGDSLERFEEALALRNVSLTCEVFQSWGSSLTRQELCLQFPSSRRDCHCKCCIPCFLSDSNPDAQEECCCPWLGGSWYKRMERRERQKQVYVFQEGL